MRFDLLSYYSKCDAKSKWDEFLVQGLMPSPKSGTVTSTLDSTLTEFKR
jgi:hypothetical protein